MDFWGNGGVIGSLLLHVRTRGCEAEARDPSNIGAKVRRGICCSIGDVVVGYGEYHHC